MSKLGFFSSTTGKIPAEPLDTPITHASITKILAQPKVSEVVEDVIIKKICKMYERSTKPCVLVDAGVTRFRMQKETRELIQATGMVRIIIYSVSGILILYR